MTSRAQQKDTAADQELYDCLTATPPRSFLMVAGAGSGKTTSLIKGLSKILSKHGHLLKSRRQRVACITYTEVAAKEIWADVGNNPLVHVSTIHSFLWLLVRSFQKDIQDWVTKRIDDKLAELRHTSANFGSRVQQRTREKNQADITRYEIQKSKIGGVRAFTYGTGSDYVNGILGHDDILKIAPQFIVEGSLIRSVLAQQFPFLFVDESQDTMESVVLALKAVARELSGSFCLGFFGDPMQRIYQTGTGAIAAEAGWTTITKPENFRCPMSVLTVANAIRSSGDGMEQTRGRTEKTEDGEQSVQGSAHIFILPADEKRDERIALVRSWTAKNSGDPVWQANAEHDAVKLLVIVHRMAANRLGFGDLYAALNDKAPDKFKNGFLDGTAWPVRPFNAFVLPLALAIKTGQEFEAMQIIRSQSTLLKREKLNGIDIAGRLEELKRTTDLLGQMMEPESVATNRDVLNLLYKSKLFTLDPRLLSYLKLPVLVEPEVQKQAENTEDDGEELTKEVLAMDAFLACKASQFLGYYRYINAESPFSTQQGIKGAEFDRVLVVLDDDEGTHIQFSYEKYLGIKPLSDNEEKNRREGKETTVDRTRRLFYVCCTRALKDLVVVLFTTHVENAKRQIETLGLFPPASIHLEQELSP